MLRWYHENFLYAGNGNVDFSRLRRRVRLLLRKLRLFIRLDMEIRMYTVIRMDMRIPTGIMESGLAVFIIRPISGHIRTITILTPITTVSTACDFRHTPGISHPIIILPEIVRLAEAIAFTAVCVADVDVFKPL